MEPRIRRATPEDAAGVAEVAERTFRDTFESMNRAEDMDAYCALSYGEAIQRSEIERPDWITFVAGDRERFAGYAQFGPSRQKWAEYEIKRFYIDREWHGRGLAQRLMREIWRTIHDAGARSVWLSVWEHNQRAIAFYAKLGYVKVGTQPFLLGSDLQTDDVLVREIGEADVG